MSQLGSAGPEIRRGAIYREVYEKRLGDRTGGREEVVGEAELEVGRIENRVLSFESSGSRARALRDGLFLLEMPPGFDPSAGDELAAGFYRGHGDSLYGHLRHLGSEMFGDPLLGFHERVNQIEQFLLERRFWRQTFPAEVVAMAEALTVLAKQILRSVLETVGIPAPLWAQATGGCSEADGSYHLTFNHYRPSVNDIGLNSHKDDGFVTVLRTTMRGLQVNRQDRWEWVPTTPDHLVVNFGLAMEILTAGCPSPVAAIMHRVVQQDTDRHSFGHFSSSRCEPGDDDGIYRYLPGGGLVRVCGSRELIDANDEEIYVGTDVPGQEG